MLENFGRKVFLVVVVLAFALGFLLIKPRLAEDGKGGSPFRLGLDLKGGTRLVYRLDFEKNKDKLSQVELQDTTQLLNDTIAIIRNRVDPSGVLEPVIRPEGSNRIVIELPGQFDVQGERIASSLQNEVGQGGNIPIALAGGELDSFPIGGGLIQIGDEVLRYARRDGSTLFVDPQGRGQRGTNDTLHPAGTRVELVSDDAIRSRIESLGDLAFMIVANASDYSQLGTDATTERTKLDTWVSQNPGLPLATFNRFAGQETGPHANIRWYPSEQPEGAPPMPELERAVAVLHPSEPDQVFRGSDLARVYPTQDQLGYPAVGFELRTERRSDFGHFTEENLNRSMAIVLNEEVASAPNIDERLPGSGIIRGQFSVEEVRNLITVLRSGSLTIAPELEYEEIVGPTLGADYVRRGYLSGIVALVVVVGFMISYYRKLGVFSALALLVNFTLLLGGLSFLNATLTLPGIAGLILTLGMAVDSNILIFDRIREEKDKGRNPKQAAKTGFEKALSAILDSNIVTFLTAVILYRIGTGPVRGFAVTLMIGLVTSVFCALVVTRIFVHWSLTRDSKHFTTGSWMRNANFDFLGKTKLCVTLSTLAVVGGLVLFLSTPEGEKLGIDFTGGAEVQLRTNEPQSIDTMRARVAAIPGRIGSSAEVKPILSSAIGDGYTDFRAVFKTLAEQGEDFESEIRAALPDVLLKDGVQVVVHEEGTMHKLDVSLFFEEPHPTSDLEARLGQAGLTAVTVGQDPERANAYRGSAEVSAGLGEAEISTQIKNQFRDASDSNGSKYRLATPIPSSSQVGPQVVGELRDKALLAIAISLFVVVMYIRVRFAEYSFGFAAVVALAHDVLITLGGMTLANKLGLVNGEISLTMIAVFLTIIGYSLNDTIVIFDRVRENLPRTKASFRDVLNTSVNQTLSRTILTSLTVFMSVVCMYVFNFGTGNVLESFSFAMMIGVISGTYSTVYIATPMLVWLEGRRTRKGPPSSRPRVAEPEPGSRPSGTAFAQK